MKKFWLLFMPGVVIGMLIILGLSGGMKATSKNEYCATCHIHPQATTSWKQSVHYITRSGDRTGCIECHLPPKGEGHIPAKVKTGIRDIWGKWTKDPDSFDWDDRSRLENARHYVPESSCLHCHENIFTPGLSKAGENAHLYYDQAEKGGDLHCINCHLNAGHYMEGYSHEGNEGFGKVTSGPSELFDSPARVDSFNSFTEMIPGSSVQFRMMAIPGSTFVMGSPEDEPFRDDDEGPQVKVSVDSFYMGEVEVTWDEYLAFYSQTSGQGRSSDTEAITKDRGVDAISGATPPYGQPDQNWGKGQRPVISISFHAAETYCKWLSQVTGKRYRLPTEAEWEYACRGGTETPYFFAGDPLKFQREGFLSRIRKNDTTVINSYVVYIENSRARTQEPSRVKSNPFGLLNMSGNVAEFCSDVYSPVAYNFFSANGTDNPEWQGEGTEHVVRGGSYRSQAGELRSANRDYTRTTSWLRTDPQVPKSIWWYSDCFHVGFRVVCEFDENSGKKDNQSY